MKNVRKLSGPRVFDITPIAFVVCNGIAEVLKMDPNLVCAPSLGETPHLYGIIL